MTIIYTRQGSDDKLGGPFSGRDGSDSANWPGLRGAAALEVGGAWAARLACGGRRKAACCHCIAWAARLACGAPEGGLLTGPVACSAGLGLACGAR
mgnify:CR=1 FL=1